MHVIIVENLSDEEAIDRVDRLRSCVTTIGCVIKAGSRIPLIEGHLRPFLDQSYRPLDDHKTRSVFDLYHIVSPGISRRRRGSSRARSRGRYQK